MEHWTTELSGSAYRLSKGRPRGGAATVLSVNLADRSDVDAPSSGGGVSDKNLDTSNGIAFVSEPTALARSMATRLGLGGGFGPGDA